ncbi:MAG TPA: hypothetical protein VMI75_37715 [Polyangiaceae bacterium]|nr:hypothetical protein [Polyangiaceae bacterium]
MNVWKPVALVAVAGMVASVGMQVAHADNACHNQGHMQAALDHLKAARNELNSAEHNKGGWRDAAIQATDKALGETNRGCAFADTH